MDFTISHYLCLFPVGEEIARPRRSTPTPTLTPGPGPDTPRLASSECTDACGRVLNAALLLIFLFRFPAVNGYQITP